MKLFVSSAVTTAAAASSLAVLFSHLPFASGALDCTAVLAERQTIDNGGGDGDEVCYYFGGGTSTIDSEIYIDWYNNQSIDVKYPNHVFLHGSDPNDPNNGIAVHWTVDQTHVYLAIASPSSGYVGFGLAEAGGMDGADMVILEAANPNVLVDAYTTDTKIPIVDDCEGNWELLDSQADDSEGFLFFETRRLLNTGDPQDRIIVDDSSMLTPPHRVIAAWGDTESKKYEYHGLFNRARGSIRFFGTGSNQVLFETAMDRSAEGSFTVQSIDYEIPARETEYHYTCVTKNDMIAQGLPNTDEKLYLIGFEPWVQQGNEAYVHHYIVYGYQSPNCDDITSIPGELFYAWAPGGHAFALPDFLGFPFNGEGEINSFQIEVHYNNPTLQSGVIDSSGAIFYWTTQPREIEAGMYSTADPGLSLFRENVGEGLTKHTFECPSSCSQDVLEDLDEQSVTVFREALHMHQTGVHMTNELIRDGEVIHKGVYNYWDFDQDGAGALTQEAFTVEAGDSFRTSCYYNADADTRFGVGSQDEMCIAFLVYYPRVKMSLFGGAFQIPWLCAYDIPLPSCSATYEMETLASDDVFDRTFGTSVDSANCPAPPSSPPPDDTTTNPPPPDVGGETDGGSTTFDGEIESNEEVDDSTDSEKSDGVVVGEDFVIAASSGSSVVVASSVLLLGTTLSASFAALFL